MCGSVAGAEKKAEPIEGRDCSLESIRACHVNSELVTFTQELWPTVLQG